MAYCNGLCKHLNRRRRLCGKTGEKLSYCKTQYGEVYEHKGYLDCDKKTEVWLYSDIDDLIDMDYDN